MKVHTLILYILFLCLQSNVNWAQDVESTWQNLQDRAKQDPLKINGNLNLLSQYYNHSGDQQRALPFMIKASGGIQFDLMGLKIPLSIAYGNGGLVFNKRLPSYNFIGLSPKYKWAAVHIGNRTMDFGKYSFSNHSFQGIGLELVPGNWHFSAFYGRLRRARAEDFQGIQNVESFYKRLGYGLKAGYQTKNDQILLSLFNAWDLEQDFNLNNENTYASENLILSIDAKKSISKRLSLISEFSRSFFNPEIPGTNVNSGQLSFARIFGSENSTSKSNAFNAGLKLNLNRLKLDALYERIDPFYNTMGALFFQNDLENMSLGIQARTFKNKLLVNTRFGLQKNNLDDSQANAYRRFITSVNLNFRISNGFSVFANYSNFNNVNRRRTLLSPNTPIVVTNLQLNTLQTNIGFNYTMNKNLVRIHNLSGNLNYSESLTIEDESINPLSQVNTLNAHLNYFIHFKSPQLQIGTSTSFQKNSFGNSDQQFINVGVNASKSIFKERLQIAFMYNHSFTGQILIDQEETQGNLNVFNFSVLWNLNRSSQLMWQTYYLENKTKNVSGNTNFSELRSSLQLKYRFQTR